MKVVWMYRDFFASLRFKNSLVTVLFIKLAFLWAIFYFFHDNPYKTTPYDAPSAIAEKLKSQQ